MSYRFIEVYRIQKKNGEGPYRGSHSLSEYRDFEDRHSLGFYDLAARNKVENFLPFRRSIESELWKLEGDGSLEPSKVYTKAYQHRKGFKTGFANLLQLFSWYGDGDELALLFKNGFRIYKVKADPDSIVVTGTQVIFKPSRQSDIKNAMPMTMQELEALKNNSEIDKILKRHLVWKKTVDSMSDEWAEKLLEKVKHRRS